MNFKKSIVRRLRKTIHVACPLGRRRKTGEPCDRQIPSFDQRHCCGVKLTLCGLRTSKKELLILTCHRIDGDGDGATPAYMHRWNIETGFEKLKSHGFHMESNRLQGGGKTGLWPHRLSQRHGAILVEHGSVKNIAPIKPKKHGRPAHSVFARGLMLLDDLLHGVAKELRQVQQAILTFLRTAIAEQENSRVLWLCDTSFIVSAKEISEVLLNHSKRKDLHLLNQNYYHWALGKTSLV